MKSLLRNSLIAGLFFGIILGLGGCKPEPLKNTVQTYRNDDFDLSFQYPFNWEMEERPGRLDSPADVAKHQIIFTQPHEGSLGISVFAAVSDWPLGNDSIAYAVNHGLLDLQKRKGLVSGKEAYMWYIPDSDHDSAGITVAFQGDKYTYLIGFAEPGLDMFGTKLLLDTLSTGSGGPTSLPLKISDFFGPNTIDYNVASSVAGVGPSKNLNFTVRTEQEKAVLYTKDVDGSLTKTGLEVEYDWDTSAYPVDIVLAVSPNGEKVAFNKWNEEKLKMEIFVSDIDGENSKKIAEQEVSEGNGELDPYSIFWTLGSDGVNYSELVSPGEGCEADQNCRVTEVQYQVDIATGKKQLFSNTPVDKITA